MAELATKECIPCKEGALPLRQPELTELQDKLGEGWQVVAEHHLEKEYRFTDFRTALAFTNRVGELAESQGHHPDIHLSWGRVRLVIWTHKVDGLTESDFIFAAKTDGIKVP